MEFIDKQILRRVRTDRCSIEAGVGYIGKTKCAGVGNGRAFQRRRVVEKYSRGQVRLDCRVKNIAEERRLRGSDRTQALKIGGQAEIRHAGHQDVLGTEQFQAGHSTQFITYSPVDDGEGCQVKWRGREKIISPAPHDKKAAGEVWVQESLGCRKLRLHARQRN